MNNIAGQKKNITLTGKFFFYYYIKITLCYMLMKNTNIHTLIIFIKIVYIIYTIQLIVVQRIQKLTILMNMVIGKFSLLK